MNFNPAAFTCLILLMHCYLFWNVQKAFDLGKGKTPVIALFALLMTGACFRSHIINLPYGPIVVYGIFLWVGQLLLFTLFAAIRHLFYALSSGVNRLYDVKWRQMLATPTAFRVALALGVVALAYSLYEVRDVKVRHLAIKTDKLPESVDTLRIVAVADLHLTRSTSDSQLENIVGLANAQNPDILVLLGDTVDDALRDQARLRTRLGQSRARLGKFAINGNHEFYSGLEQAEDFIRKTGFTLLKGESVECGGIAVVGVDDPVILDRVGIADALKTADPEKFVLLLAHRPETPEDARGRFDLQLSGHTHGGQMWPGRYRVWLDSGYWQGLTFLRPAADRPKRRSLLYLSNGAGYWGPPVRFLAPPEITVIDLTR